MKLFINNKFVKNGRKNILSNVVKHKSYLSKCYDLFKSFYLDVLLNIMFYLEHLSIDLKSILYGNIFLQKMQHPDHVSILKFDDSY